MLRRPTFRASLLFAVLGAGAASWSTDRTSGAYVGLAEDVGRPGEVPAVPVARPTPDERAMLDVPSHDPYYRVTTAAPRECHLGTECVISVTMIPAAGWYPNVAAPWKLTADAEAGLLFRTERSRPATSEHGVFGREHFDLRGEAAVVHVVVRPTTAGSHRIKGRLKVYICAEAESLCKSSQQDLVVELPVT